LKTTKLGRETGIAFYSICITCHEEEKLQLVFVAEIVCEREQAKLICILACGERIIWDLQESLHEIKPSMQNLNEKPLKRTETAIF